MVFMSFLLEERVWQRHMISTHTNAIMGPMSSAAKTSSVQPDTHNQVCGLFGVDIQDRDNSKSK